MTLSLSVHHWSTGQVSGHKLENMASNMFTSCYATGDRQPATAAAASGMSLN